MSKPPYLPFVDGQWHLAMGLKPFQIKDWIEIDETFSAQLALKAQLLTERYSDVFASLLDSETGQREVLELLVDHLLQFFPTHYRRQGNHLFNRATEQVWDLTAFEQNPLDLAGRLVQEDLCLMLPGDEGYELAAASVCFPLRWRLREKLGKAIAHVHSTVPSYPEKLQRPVNQFFDRLKPDYPGYRLNWSIVDTPDLFLDQHKGEEGLNSSVTPENAGDRLWLRVERQTLRRLNISGGVLFTIRTYVHPLHLLADEPAILTRLATAIQQIPAAMQAYKNLIPIRTALLSYLEQAIVASTKCE